MSVAWAVAAVTGLQCEVLQSLDDGLWLRPVDVEGRDASHHSKTHRRTPAGQTAARGACPTVRLQWVPRSAG